LALRNARAVYGMPGRRANSPAIHRPPRAVTPARRCGGCGRLALGAGAGPMPCAPASGRPAPARRSGAARPPGVTPRCGGAGPGGSALPRCAVPSAALRRPRSAALCGLAAGVLGLGASARGLCAPGRRPGSPRRPGRCGSRLRFACPRSSLRPGSGRLGGQGPPFGVSAAAAPGLRGGWPHASERASVPALRAVWAVCLSRLLAYLYERMVPCKTSSAFSSSSPCWRLRPCPCSRR